MRLAVLSIPLLLLLSACSSSQPQISISQPLVMESDVLSAGITTDGPVVRSDSGQQKATVILYNDRDVPVTLHYRYFWYDDKGLEILPRIGMCQLANGKRCSENALIGGGCAL